MTGQTLIIMLGALLLMLSTVRLVRNRLLSIRYGIGWLIVASIGLVGSPVLTFIVNRLDLFGFTPTGFSLGIFILFLGLVCLQLSVSLSGLHRAIQDITEHSAHVEARLRRIEGSNAPDEAVRAVAHTVVRGHDEPVPSSHDPVDAEGAPTRGSLLPSGPTRAGTHESISEVPR